MEYYRKILKESIIIVIISSIIGIFSGTLLSFNQEIIYTIPIILLILPSLNSLVGDVSTVLVSRLTTHLYIGSIPPKIQKSDRITEDFLGLLITTLLSLFVLTFFGFLIGIYTGIPLIEPFLFFFIISLTTLTLFFVLFFLLFIGSVYLFNKGKDPNNFLIPFVTSLADFLTPLLLIIFIIMFI